jgi:glycosyltransferase involved in cell wall biosynthesis
MISVLIPVYNTSVVELVQELSRQLETLEIDGEIIVIDDASGDDYRMQNRSIAQLSKAVYKELAQNVGRLHIRKVLSVEAKHSSLIFLDGDSQIIHSSFLKNYVEAIQANKQVIIGGRVYQKEKPRDCSKVLHWKYGRERENIVQRKNGFHTNNFSIKKELFDKLKFDDEWEGYGHEDTFIGIQLEKLGVTTHYINNAVLHNGIEEAEVFIPKSLQAIENLKILSRQVDEGLLRKHVRLFDQYCKLKKIGLTGFIVQLYKRYKISIEHNLTSCSPSLALFDIYRLAYFILINQKNSFVKS